MPGALPTDFIKLEGLVTLKLGQQQQGRALLRRYREVLIQTLDDQLLFDTVPESKQAIVWSEAAASALVDGSASDARNYAFKAIQLDSSQTSAYKTLVWASVKTGESTMEQEDIIFSFFLNYVRDDTRAEEYYQLCTASHPNCAFYYYAYARFLQLVRYKLDFCSSLCPHRMLSSPPLILDTAKQSKRDYTHAEKHYLRAQELLPDNSRILERCNSGTVKYAGASSGS